MTKLVRAPHDFSGSAGRVAEREGFMQTRCHDHSVTKLVTAPHDFSGSAGRVAEREGIHADRQPHPVRDEASQGSTASAKRKQGGRATQLDSRATGLDNNSLF
jgi:hypothetical protein